MRIVQTSYNWVCILLHCKQFCLWKNIYFFEQKHEISCAILWRKSISFLLDHWINCFLRSTFKVYRTLILVVGLILNCLNITNIRRFYLSLISAAIPVVWVNANCLGIVYFFHFIRNKTTLTSPYGSFHIYS